MLHTAEPVQRTKNPCQTSLQLTWSLVRSSVSQKLTNLFAFAASVCLGYGHNMVENGTPFLYVARHMSQELNYGQYNFCDSGLVTAMTVRDRYFLVVSVVCRVAKLVVL